MNIKFLVRILAAFAVSSLWALQTAHANTTLVSRIDQDNFVTKINQLYVVHLAGKDFKTMGQHYGELLKPQLQQQLQHEEASTHFKAKGIVATLLLDTFINNKKMTNNEQAFLNGAATGSGLSLHEMLYMNLSFMFSVRDRPTLKAPTLCSFIAKQVNNTTVIGRNLEWTTLFHGSQGQGPIVVTVFNLKDGLPHNKIATIGYLGWFDATTAINDRGLFAEVNSGEGSSNAIDIFHTPNLSTQLFDDLLKDNTLEELERDVYDSPTSLAYIVNLAGPSNNNEPFTYSVEKALTPTNRFLPIIYKTSSLSRSSNTPTYYPLPVTSDLLIATNTFRIKGWDALLKNPYPSLDPYPSLSDDSGRKSFHRYNNLMQLATTAQTWQSDADETMKRIISTPLQRDGSGGSAFVGLDPSDTLYTYYSVVFNANSKTLYINDPMGDNTWTRLNAETLGFN